MDNKLGLSMCVPLWGKLKPNEYYGTYCTDIFPASKSGGKFLNKYFDDIS
jgi:hypothetical protein